MPTERIELPRDASDAEPDPGQVRAVAEAIRAGKTVVLPTETVYGLAALPDQTQALRDFKGRDDANPFTWHLGSARPPTDDDRVRRLMAAFWPGPLTLVLPHGDGTRGYRVPRHAFTRAVIDVANSAGLLMTSVNASGRAPLTTSGEIEHELGDRIDVLVVDDAAATHLASTVARVEPTEIELLREGAITSDLLYRSLATTILFVCTGNTCRSPLAEAIARAAVAERLGIEPAKLRDHGIDVQSAGVGAGHGAPASEHSVTVGAEIGLDLNSHRSQPLIPELLASSDAVYCLSDSHAAAILAHAPDAADRVDLLDPTGASIPDPFGADLETYRAARDRIRECVLQRVDDWFADAR